MRMIGCASILVGPSDAFCSHLSLLRVSARTISCESLPVIREDEIDVAGSLGHVEAQKIMVATTSCHHPVYMHHIIHHTNALAILWLSQN